MFYFFLFFVLARQSAATPAPVARRVMVAGSGVVTQRIVEQTVDGVGVWAKTTVDRVANPARVTTTNTSRRRNIESPSVLPGTQVPLGGRRFMQFPWRIDSSKFSANSI